MCVVEGPAVLLLSPMALQSSSPSVSQTADRKSFDHGKGTDHLRTGVRCQRTYSLLPSRNTAGGKAPMTSSASGHECLNPVNVKKTWPSTMDQSPFFFYWWYLTVISDKMNGINGFLHFDSSFFCKLTIV